MSSNQFLLLKEKRFVPFFWVQFLGALNDNVFKTALLTMLAYDGLHWTTADSGMITNLIPGLFILPFFLFSASAGQFAEKYDKTHIARWVKIAELVIMLIAAWGWISHQLWLLIVAIVGMGLHSTVFGPVKYAYLPQHLKQQELIGGNGLVEMGTFVGILLGEIIGALLVVHGLWGRELVVSVTIGLAIIGWLCSLRMPPSPPSMPTLTLNWNPVTETIRNIRYMKQNKVVFRAVMGNSWFWFYGAIILAQFPVYTKSILHGDHSVFVLLLIAFTLGVGIGSLLCEKISAHQIELGVVPLGAIGLTLFGIDLYIATEMYHLTNTMNALSFIQYIQGWHILIACTGIGLFGGFYIVPLFAIIQSKSELQFVSRSIAGLNIMNALLMVLSALFAMALLQLGCSIAQIFLITALLNIVVTGYLFKKEPLFIKRFAIWSGITNVK